MGENAVADQPSDAAEKNSRRDQKSKAPGAGAVGRGRRRGGHDRNEVGASIGSAQFITRATRGDVNFDSARCAVLIALAGASLLRRGEHGVEGDLAVL